METQREILKEKRKWSLMWNGTAEQLKGVRAEQQTRSREWPLMCSGKVRELPETITVEQWKKVLGEDKRTFHVYVEISQQNDIRGESGEVGESI